MHGISGIFASPRPEFKNKYSWTYCQYFKIITMHDLYQAFRESNFSKRPNKQRFKRTDNTTISCLAQAFRSNHRKDLRLVRYGKTQVLLQEKTKGFKNQDKSNKKQKTLTSLILISI